MTNLDQQIKSLDQLLNSLEQLITSYIDQFRPVNSPFHTQSLLKNYR